MAQKITVETRVPVSQEAAWDAYTSPEEITKWNFASPDWHCPNASVDLRVGGQHSARMEAKDGSMGFDFAGTYEVVEKPQSLALRLGDGRLSRTSFEKDEGGTIIRTSFDVEAANDPEMQRAGWQAILDNYADYVTRKPR
ncbi:MAG: SRPBCC domain-containing protein [Paracoccus sp. (in: a-proteobacteria)]|nr:SRPBCC domain-containing protein [Paracoccus sp. (in: a-proteobacteria)]